MARKPSYLTERQKAILEFISEFQEAQGMAPTHREICERFGFSSYGTAYKHLKLLADKGFLRRDWNQKRGLEMLRPVPGRRAAVHGAGAGNGAVELPFHGRIAAGRPIEALPAGDSLLVPTLLAGAARPGEHYVLQVAGDSMIGEGIHDGDWVVVEKRERAESGEMVVALLGEEATLKRLYAEGTAEQPIARLQPSNPALQPLRVPAGDVQVQGVVVGLMRKY
jgi:repressor LexA